MGAAVCEVVGQIVRTGVPVEFGDWLAVYCEVFDVPFSATQWLVQYHDYCQNTGSITVCQQAIENDDSNFLPRLLIFSFSVCTSQQEAALDVLAATFGLDPEQLRAATPRADRFANAGWAETLCVSASATMDQVRAAYRTLATQYHPDRVLADGVEKAAHKMREINAAYEAACAYLEESGVRGDGDASEWDALLRHARQRYASWQQSQANRTAQKAEKTGTAKAHAAKNERHHEQSPQDRVDRSKPSDAGERGTAAGPPHKQHTQTAATSTSRGTPVVTGHVVVIAVVVALLTMLTAPLLERPSASTASTSSDGDNPDRATAFDDMRSPNPRGDGSNASGAMESDPHDPPQPKNSAQAATYRWKRAEAILEPYVTVQESDYTSWAGAIWTDATDEQLSTLHTGLKKLHQGNALAAHTAFSSLLDEPLEAPPEVYLARGVSAAVLHRWADACRDHRFAAQVDPGISEFRSYDLSRAYLAVAINLKVESKHPTVAHDETKSLPLLESALELASEAIACHPSSSIAYRIRAEIRRSLGDQQGSDEDGRHALDVAGTESDFLQRRKLAEFAAPYRTWADTSGDFTVQATFLRAAGNSVQLLKDENGRAITVPLEIFSEADREWLALTGALAAPSTHH